MAVRTIQLLRNDFIILREYAAQLCICSKLHEVDIIRLLTQFLWPKDFLFLFSRRTQSFIFAFRVPRVKNSELGQRRPPL
jgi:hypothetical protein